MRAWVDDSMVDACQSCNVRFSFYKRKHHCRMCGRIFCYACCCTWRKLPEELILSKSASIHTPTMFVNWWNMTHKEHRICIHCDVQMSNLERYRLYAQALNIIQLDLHDFSRLICVNRKWSVIGRQYKERFRELQYHLWNQKHNHLERRCLRTNRLYLHGHRLWMKQLLAAQESESSLNRTLEMLYQNRRHRYPCKQLQCSRTCDRYLYLTDWISILNNLSTRGIFHNRCVIRHISETLTRGDSEEVLATLPWWVRFLSQKTTQLTESLLCVAKKDACVAVHLFWNIVVATKLYPEKSLYRGMLRKILRAIPKLWAKRIQEGYMIGRALESLPKHPKVTEVAEALTNIHTSHLPTECSGRATTLFPEQARITTSANCPVYIPGIAYEKKDDEKIRYQSSLLFKQEDVRVDCVVMNVIRFMNLVLKRNNMDLDIVTYDVIPISDQAGCIKIVPDSYTLYKVKEEFKFTIQNFILEHNPDMTIQTIRRRFMHSCAGACVVSFLLGLGDRHLENIMITTTGRLFHIDFDFVLGQDAKPFQPEMRITPEMVDAMGGETSSLYEEFQCLCTQAYNYLRTYVDIFAVMLNELSVINPDRYPREQITRQIIRRFVPGESDRMAQLQFKTILNKSWNSRTSSQIADFIHRQHQNNPLHELRDMCKSKVQVISDYIALKFFS